MSLYCHTWPTRCLLCQAGLERAPALMALVEGAAVPSSSRCLAVAHLPVDEVTDDEDYWQACEMAEAELRRGQSGGARPMADPFAALW